MKININKTILLLIVSFIIAFAIRLYQLSFFEFKNDQYIAIGLGNDTRAAHFLITHGMRSGLWLDNPPFFAYVMGILTAFTNDPAQVTFYFFCINILALALTIIYFYYTLPDKYAVLSAAFLALSPAFTIYSNNIWAQCLLPIIAILFNISLYRFIKYALWRNFFYMSLLVVIAAQIHGSGFWLFPLLVMIAIAYWKKMDKKAVLLSLLAAVLLCIPYLIHLIKEKELSELIRFSVSTTKRTVHWEILASHVHMASFDFFKGYYFGDNFNEILQNMAGKWHFVLYPLTFIPGLLFILGFAAYIRWLIKGKIFAKSEGNFKEYPLPFQISGLMILVVTLGYLIFRIPAGLPYLIVLYPAYSVLTGFAAFKIWPYYWGKIIVLLGILSTGILLVCTLLFIDKAGGLPNEYSFSYKTLISWKKEIQAMKHNGECFDLKVNFIGYGKADLETVLAVLNDNNKCKPGERIIPAEIDINWNDKLMRYEHHLNDGNI